jgi:hypothetical protein
MLHKLQPNEKLVEISKTTSGKYSVEVITDTGEGMLGGDCIALCDRMPEGILRASAHFHSNKPRLLSATADRVCVAFRDKPTHRYICHVWFIGGEGEMRYTIDAESAEEAFEKTLESLQEDAVDPEREHKAIEGEEAIESIDIEAASPLKPGQHPDTPPLWNVVGTWVPVPRRGVDWVRQIPQEPEAEQQHKFKMTPAEATAFAQAYAPPGTVAKVMEVTEFGTTGTYVPSSN